MNSKFWFQCGKFCWRLPRKISVEIFESVSAGPVEPGAGGFAITPQILVDSKYVQPNDLLLLLKTGFNLKNFNGSST